MLEKLQRNAGYLAFACQIGASLRDKLLVLWLLMKHIAVNRGWTRYTSTVHRIDAHIDGKHFIVHLRDNGTDAIIFEDVFHRRCYSLDGDPKTIVDAGANIGLASLYLSLMHPQASIASFEPVEHELCKRNARHVLELALGKSEGSISILIDPNNSGGHRLELYDTDPSLQRLQVPLRRLDVLIDEGKIPAPELLKIDAEGSECDILEGLGEHIQSLRFLLAEAQSKKNHDWIIAHLRGNGIAHIEERILHPEAHLPGDAYSIIVARR